MFLAKSTLFTTSYHAAYTSQINELGVIWKIWSYSFIWYITIVLICRCYSDKHVWINTTFHILRMSKLLRQNWLHLVDNYYLLEWSRMSRLVCMERSWKARLLKQTFVSVVWAIIEIFIFCYDHFLIFFKIVNLQPVTVLSTIIANK